MKSAARAGFGIVLVVALLLLSPIVPHGAPRGLAGGGSSATTLGAPTPPTPYPDPGSPGIHAEAPLLPAPRSADLTGRSSPIGNPSLAEQGLRASAAASIPAYDAFVPRPSATAAQEAEADATGHVTPLYAGDGPAPMGVADYGLSAGLGGQIVPSTVNTTELEGTFNTTSSGIQPLYLDAAAPQGYSVDLAATSSDVSVLGISNYTFWFEDAAEYFADTDRLVFIANVWDFSSGVLPPQTFSNLTNGTEVGFSYVTASYVVPFAVSNPFNVTLLINSTLNGTRDQVNFSAGVHAPSSGQHPLVPFEQVAFSATASEPAISAATLTAEGSRYNPVGLTDDFELVLGGPGGGAQTNIYRANATLGLDLWNVSKDSFTPVPSAYSYGGDAAETASGVSIGWQPGSTEGLVSEGPSILRGLWNASGTAGLDPVNVSLNVPNAFVFFTTPSGGNNFTSGDGVYWAPDVETTEYALPPGTYNVTALLSGYTPLVSSNLVVPPGGSATVTLDLIANPSEGIYTPLWAWNTATLESISSTGAGTPTDPYQLVNEQYQDIGSLFGEFNDLTFPVFAGVFLDGFNASVMLSAMPALTVMSPYSFTPGVNDLTYQFYDTEGVGLVNSTYIGGWFTNLLGSGYPRVATESVVLWDSSEDLIANDTFATQTAGVYLYGGTSTTIWGNTFTMVPTPPFPSTTLYLLNLSLGLEVAGSGDQIYNNAFDTTTTAVTPVEDPYTGAYVVPQDQWNITPISASATSHAALFPSFPLVGSIIGSVDQGGNYWWDYGTPTDPFGELPYIAGGDIASGGDFAPLLPGPLANVTLTESGLVSGTPWTVDVFDTTTGIVLYAVNVTAPNDTVLLPSNGSYLAVGTAGPLEASVTFAVLGALDVTLYFGLAYSATFRESGLPTGTSWGVRLDYRTFRSTGAQIIVELLNGTWPYSVLTPAGFTGLPIGGSVLIAGGVVTESISFAPVRYLVTFTPTGLILGVEWYLSVDGEALSAHAPASITLSLGNGSYVASYNATGYTVTPASTEVVVDGAPTVILVPFVMIPVYPLTFSESGLTAGTPWTITIAGVASQAGTNSTITFLLPNRIAPYRWDAGAVPRFSGAPTNGSVLEVGELVEISITFVALPTYPVTFAEAGLPSGTTWSVNISGLVGSTSGTTILFHLTAGPYRYTLLVVPGYSAEPNGGKFNLTPVPLNFSIQFTPVTPGAYIVTFSETGLRSGTNWSVLFGSTTEFSTASTLTLVSGNGTYSWVASPVAGFSASPASGTVTIRGQDTAVSVTYTAVPQGSYAVTFTETGLPLGTNWSVALGSNLRSSSGTTIVFIEPNASYNFSVAPISGFTASVVAGTVEVTGAPIAVNFGFLANPLPNHYLGVSYLEWGVVLAAIAVLTVLLVLLLRRRGRTHPHVPSRLSP